MGLKYRNLILNGSVTLVELAKTDNEKGRK